MASKRKNRGLSRKTAEKQPYDGVLIVCEGTKTEKNYFANLITHEKLSSVVNIEIIHGNGTDLVFCCKYSHRGKRENGESFAF
ncbi:RloB family protein [Kingella kingae]|uniref:RloB family protein n=1 Tax=Kingella kingae TaxID=504 RepID=UPI001E5CA403|nr:RloB family protein [Kingella kingae]